MYRLEGVVNSYLLHDFHLEADAGIELTQFSR